MYSRSASLQTIAALASERERDMSRFTPYHFVFIAVGDTHAEAHRVAVEQLAKRYRQPFETLVERYCALGTAQECVERLQRFADAGARHFILLPSVTSTRWVSTWTSMPATSCLNYAKPWAWRLHPLPNFSPVRERTERGTAYGRRCMLI